MSPEEPPADDFPPRRPFGVRGATNAPGRPAAGEDDERPPALAGAAPAATHPSAARP